MPTDDGIEGQCDSQNESGEWEGEVENWEREEGSGESENSAQVGVSQEEHEEEEGTASEEEEEIEEDDGEDGKQEELRDEEDENTIAAETPGVRDISLNERASPPQNEREHLFRRVGPLPLRPHIINPITPTPITPQRTPLSPTAKRQWLLELALVLLITTLLVTICSRLSYEWVMRLLTINQEKPI